MKKKTIIMALGLLLLPVAGMAQTLVLTQRNGTVNRFALSDEPVITYSGSDVVVKCGDSELVTDMADVLSCTFDSETTAIDKLPAQPGGAEAKMNFAGMSVEGLRAGDRVAVYTIDGKAVSSSRANADGSAALQLDGPRGSVYIVRTPNKTFKIKK